MNEYVRNYIGSCLQCLTSKPNRGVSKGPIYMIPRKKRTI